jgi:probable addiction module antidote protein
MFSIRQKGLEMRKTIHVDDLPEFDPAQYLDNEESIAVYLTGILEANNAALLASALGDIARARGMTEVAKAAGITREALYKALRPGSAPRFETISRVCAALGVRLVAQPMPARKAAAWKSVCGRKNAPPFFETMVVLGRDVCLARIRQAEERLRSLA